MRIRVPRREVDERIHSRTADLRLVAPALAELSDERTDVNRARPDDARVLGSGSDTARDLGERQALVIDRLDQPEQASRIPGRNASHTY